MKTLVCQVELFTLEQEVVILEDNQIVDKFTTDLNSLSTDLLAFSLGNQVAKVSLYGPQSYVEELGHKLMEQEGQNIYSMFEIEVNGKCLNS